MCAKLCWCQKSSPVLDFHCNGDGLVQQPNICLVMWNQCAGPIHQCGQLKQLNQAADWGKAPTLACLLASTVSPSLSTSVVLKVGVGTILEVHFRSVMKSDWKSLLCYSEAHSSDRWLPVASVGLRRPSVRGDFLVAAVSVNCVSSRMKPPWILQITCIWFSMFKWLGLYPK